MICATMAGMATDWRESPFAVASVACGVLAFVVFTVVLSILAVCFATVAMQRATAAHTSKTLAYVGYGLGLTALVGYLFIATIVN
jgi:hypothetical protein